MKQVVVALISVIFFFPLYWVLHPILGPEWGAGVAAAMMFVGFPVLILSVFRREWNNRFVRSCNIVLSALVLVATAWVWYIAISQNEKYINAALFSLFYGLPALYFIRHGKLPPIFNSNENET